MALTRNQAEDILRTRFRLNQFYDEQWETIESLLEGQRILLIHRTGFGKSLCYQFPAIRFDGITIVFSPLIALMRDQIQQLKSLGISAECINSEQTNEENSAILERARQNDVKILYIAPERQENPEWLEAVEEMNLSMVVIDEAHCISVWGHDFRPAFRRIIDLVESLPQELPVLATTATATEKVAQDIIQQMGGNVKYIRGNLMRENFILNMVRVFSEDDKLAFLAHSLPELEGTGIIYSGTRADTEEYSKFLNRQGIEAVNYNAGFDAERRREVEEGLLNNRWKCVVATNALGMGIDKPDIRFIIHTQIPASPIHYYQEIGRAGRDGREAKIILLYNPKDRELPEYFIENNRPPVQHYQRVIDSLKSKKKAEGIWDLMRKTNLNRTKIEVIIRDLIEQGIVKKVARGRSKKYEYQSDAPMLDTTAFEKFREFKLGELDKIIEYAETNRCRMFYLCDYLEDKDVRECLKCDNCRGERWIYEINAEWQQKVDDFKNNYFPEIELVSRTQQERPLSERRSKLVNGVAFSYYGFSNVGSTIHHCKYENGGDFPDFLLRGVLRAYHSYFRDEKFDLIIYVPPTESGDLVKNFAEKVSTALKIPLSHSLVKPQNTEPQKVFQNYVLKRDNVKDAFDYENLAGVVDKNVLLIDDICDSKATIREIGKLMSELSVNKIAPLVIAKTIAGDIMDDKADLPEIETDTADTKEVVSKKAEPFTEIRQKYPNAYERWTKEDDELLVNMFHQGESIAELANHFQRKKGAIRSRLKKLVGEEGARETPREKLEYNTPARDEAQLFQALRKWRLRKAEESNLPPHYIFPDKTLHNIARSRPTSPWDLLDIKGLGKTTIKKYGREIIEIINEQER
ncbi:MAG: RecQ family ATP-dependent DNA helicase [Euryarchaeota archaeon]|nr:RecQ family ATP-dependent DNA helicase [Euryarchaeota archaeon]